MKATIPYVKEKFGEFNELFFGGELPEIPVGVSDAKGFIGVCRYKRRRRPDGTWERYDFRLSINTRIDLPEQEVEDTIIHEMIHYYIGVNQLRDTSAHGEVFRRMMKEINDKHGRHITISHKNTPEQREQSYDKRPRRHVVAVVTLRDGRSGIKVIPCIAKRIRQYRRGLLLSGRVKSIEFFLTTDPFFNRFPSSAALRIYDIDPDELSAHLTDAVKITVNAFKVGL